KATAEQTKYFLDQNDRISKSILETGIVPADVPAGLKAIYPSSLGNFLKNLLSADPCVLIAAYSGPVLVVTGTRDVQISSERDAKAINAALRQRAADDHELLIVENASHNLKRVENDDEPGFTGPVVPKVLDRVSRWSSAKLSGKAEK